VTVKHNWKLVSSELKLHKKINYAYYQKIVVSCNVWRSVYKHQLYQIVESNRIELFFPESECSSNNTSEYCMYESEADIGVRAVCIITLTTDDEIPKDGPAGWRDLGLTSFWTSWSQFDPLINSRLWPAWLQNAINTIQSKCSSQSITVRNERVVYLQLGQRNYTQHKHLSSASVSLQQDFLKSRNRDSTDLVPLSQERIVILFFFSLSAVKYRSWKWSKSLLPCILIATEINRMNRIRFRSVLRLGRCLRLLVLFGISTLFIYLFIYFIYIHASNIVKRGKGNSARKLRRYSMYSFILYFTVLVICCFMLPCA